MLVFLRTPAYTQILIFNRIRESEFKSEVVEKMVADDQKDAA